MRRKLIEADLIECVLGLGPNLFYNSPMEACIVICRMDKPKERRGKILFINAVNEVTRERSQSFLTNSHIERIVKAYEQFKDAPGFAKVAPLGNVKKNDHSLKIDLYVTTPCANNGNSGETEQQSEFSDVVATWSASRFQVRDLISSLLSDLKNNVHQPENLRSTTLAEFEEQFDRSKWQSVRFGDVVRMLKEVVDPESGEVDRYVAGEHMETENIHIHKWGTIGDGYLGPAFIRRFRKGQVLYGSRRTYLKKVAMAEFDGVTANTTFVLQTDEGKLLQELLPWLMLSEKFTQHSIRESKGSTNPYINFSDIAKFEFALPPLDQQCRIAEMLRAVDDDIQKHIALASAAACAIDRSRNKHFSSSSQPKLTTVRDIGRWFSGNTPSMGRRDFWNGSFPWVSPKDMKQSLIIDSEEHLTDSGRKEATEIGPGGILIVVRGMILAHSFPVGITQKSVAFNQDMKALIPRPEFSVEYLYHWLKWATPNILRHISDSSHGTKRLAMDDLFEMKVPEPMLDEQDAFVANIQSLESFRAAVQKIVANLSHLLSALINEVFQ